MHLPRFTWALLLLGVVVLAACGGDSDDSNGGGSDASLNVTAPPLPQRVIEPGCTEDQLDGWADNVYLTITDFADSADAFSRRASNERRNEIEIVWEGFIRDRELVNSYPTPECLDQIHLALVGEMQDIIADFQAFSNAEIDADTLRNIVAPDIDTMQTLIDNLERQYAALYAET